MNRENLTEALRDLSAATGFRAALLSPGLKEIAAYPTESNTFCSYIGLHSRIEAEECAACRRSLADDAMQSGAPAITKCRHRLFEVMIPLYPYGAPSGFLSLSGVFSESESAERMTMVLSHLGKKESDARSIAASVPKISDARLGALMRIISAYAEHLSLAKEIAEPKPAISVLVKRYVDENYKNHIDLKDICKKVGYSKSTVLNSFKADSGMTVGAYICSVRLNAAIQMLRSSSLSIAEIAVKSGFSDQSYFSKVFSAQIGKTPTEYRKELKR